jgi:hypothetical protein
MNNRRVIDIIQKTEFVSIQVRRAGDLKYPDLYPNLDVS